MEPRNLPTLDHARILSSLHASWALAFVLLIGFLVVPFLLISCRLRRPDNDTTDVTCYGAHDGLLGSFLPSGAVGRTIPQHQRRRHRHHLRLADVQDWSFGQGKEALPCSICIHMCLCIYI